MEKKKKRWRAKDDTVNFYLLVAPFIIMLILIKVVPFIWGVYTSFTDYTGFNADSLQFVGMDNYSRMFSDGVLSKAIGSTLIIAGFSVPMVLLGGLGLAMLLNQDIKGSGFFRTVYYIPSIIPIVVATLMWKIIFNPNGGLLNGIIVAFNGNVINWLGFDYVRHSLFIMLMWGSGVGVLTYLAALKDVPNELYESAAIDGAGGFRRFFTITLPMLTPVIFFNLINGFIAAFQIFAQPVLLSQTAASGSLASQTPPLQPIYTYIVHVFQSIFINRRFGYGLALVWVLFIVSVAITRLTFYSSKFWVYYESDNLEGVGKKNKQFKKMVNATKGGVERGQ